MTMKQLAKTLDQNAVKFANNGQLEKAFAAMELAAHIRRKPQHFLRLRVELNGES